MTFRPETATPINELVNILLRGESTLTPGEREMTNWIDTNISSKLKALLNIAGKVQLGGKYVTEEDVATAR
jgi:hypothetical protein